MKLSFVLQVENKVLSSVERKYHSSDLLQIHLQTSGTNTQQLGFQVEQTHQIIVIYRTRS